MPPSKGRIARFVAVYKDETRVAFAAAALAFFFSHGLYLWDTDYSQWLAQAGSGLPEILLRVFSPLTSDPDTWGFSDRPLYVLICWLLHAFFGSWATGWFFVKSLAVGTLCAMVYGFLRRHCSVGAFAALFGAMILASSPATMASLLYLSDPAVYSQMAMTAAMFFAYSWFNRRIGTVRFVVMFAITVYFGAKLRGEVRMAPLAVLGYAYFFRRDVFRRLVLPVTGVFLLSLPWSLGMFSASPPYLPGAGRLAGFLFSGLSSPLKPQISVFVTVGIVLCIALLVFGVWSVGRRKIKLTYDRSGFFIAWLGAALLGCAALPGQSGAFDLRYALIALVPAVMLASIAIDEAVTVLKGASLGRFKWFVPLALMLAGLQLSLHLGASARHRMDIGRTIVAANGIHTLVEEKYSKSRFVYAPGFIAYGYKDVKSFALMNRRTIENLDRLSQFPSGDTYVASWEGILDARLSVEKVVSGCSPYSVFDWIAGCGPADGAFLFRYVGTPPEFTRAQEFEKNRDFRSASVQIEKYLQRDPANHGMAFTLSLYAYNLRNFARMESIYDAIGPFYPAITSVVYNWAIAKLGMGKFKDSIRLFRRALRLSPGDYAIGFNLADALMKSGDRKAALIQLEALLQSHPGDAALKAARDRWNK